VADLQEKRVVAAESHVDDGRSSLSTALVREASPLPLRISRALADASILARDERVVIGGGRGLAGRKDEQVFAGALKALKLAFFVIPAIFSALYLFLVAKDQYVVETRFSVRATKNATADVLSAFTGSADGLSRQATGMLATYIRSEAILRDLENEITLRERYAAPHGDFFSRFDHTKPIEDFAKYFWWKLTVSEEVSSGILGVKIRAFSPEDAVAVANGILARSEKMINELSEKNRQSILRTSQLRFERAQERLAEITRKAGLLRDHSGVLDGDVETKAQTRLIYELELALSRTIALRETQLRQLSPESSTIRNLDAQIAGIRSEIDSHRKRLTPPGGQGALSKVLAEFEAMKAEQDTARREYLASAAALEDARIDALRNELYMSVFVQPQLPESSIYPRRLLLWLGIVFTAWVLTAISISVAKTARSYRAR